MEPKSIPKEGTTGNFTDKFNSLFDKFTSQATGSTSSRSSTGADAAWLAANVPVPKFHANVCVDHPLGEEYSDYENLEVLFGPQDDYEFTMKLGRGRYSEVFRGVDLL